MSPPAAVSTASSPSSSKSEDSTYGDPIKDRVMSLGFGEAVKWSSLTCLGSSAAVVYMIQNRPWFKKLTNVSVRVAIPTMASMFIFGVAFELTIISAQRYPEKWGIIEVPLEAKKPSSSVKVVTPFHHIVLNRIYDNPFSYIAAVGLPVASFILYQQMKIKHLTIPQRIMHSRVFAQASILSIGLSTLAFREYMERRGRFPEGDELPKFHPTDSRS